MRWRTRKNKSAWVLFADEPEVFRQFPVSRFLGNDFLEKLTDISLHWQLETLVNIRKAHGETADFFIYATKENTGKIKEGLKKFKEQKKPKIKKSPDRSHNPLESIISELISSYDTITAWNLQSLVLTRSMIEHTRKKSGPAIIKSPNGRILLINTDLNKQSNNEKVEYAEIPSIYDMESLRETIYFMSHNNSPEYSLRAKTLAEMFLLTQTTQQR